MTGPSCGFSSRVLACVVAFAAASSMARTCDAQAPAGAQPSVPGAGWSPLGPALQETLRSGRPTVVVVTSRTDAASASLVKGLAQVLATQPVGNVVLLAEMPAEAYSERVKQLGVTHFPAVLVYGRNGEQLALVDHRQGAGDPYAVTAWLDGMRQAAAQAQMQAQAHNVAQTQTQNQTQPQTRATADPSVMTTQYGATPQGPTPQYSNPPAQPPVQQPVPTYQPQQQPVPTYQPQQQVLTPTYSGPPATPVVVAPPTAPVVVAPPAQTILVAPAPPPNIVFAQAAPAPTMMAMAPAAPAPAPSAPVFMAPPQPAQAPPAMAPPQPTYAMAPQPSYAMAPQPSYAMAPQPAMAPMAMAPQPSYAMAPVGQGPAVGQSPLLLATVLTNPGLIGRILGSFGELLSELKQPRMRMGQAPMISQAPVMSAPYASAPMAPGYGAAPQAYPAYPVYPAYGGQPEGPYCARHGHRKPCRTCSGHGDEGYDHGGEPAYDQGPPVQQQQPVYSGPSPSPQQSQRGWFHRD